MYQARVNTKDIRPKPRVVIDKRFPDFRELEVGDIGQADGNLHVMETAIDPDINGNEHIELRLLITQAKVLKKTSARL